MKNLKAKQLILISNRSEDIEFIEEVSRLAEVEFTCYPTSTLAKQGLAKLWRIDQCLLFVDVTSDAQLIDFDRNFTKLVGPLLGQIHPNRITLIVDTPLKKELQQTLSRNKNYSSLLFRQHASMMKAAQYYCDILRIFTTGPADDGIDEFELQTINEKAAALGLIEKLLTEKTQLQGRMVQTIVAAVDELLINAFLDAREDGKTQGVQPAPSRSTVEVCVRRTPGSVSVTVIDYYGAFDRFKALGKILPAKGETELNPDTVSSRAGIGLAMTLNLGASLSIVILPKQRTEVTVTYQEATSYREFKQQLQALSIQQ